MTEQPPDAAADDADLRPLDVDGVGAVAVGTVLWGVAFVATLVWRDDLVAAGRGWWQWVALSGFLLGLPGLWYVVRRRNAYRAARDVSR